MENHQISLISRKNYFDCREIRLDIHVLNHEGNVADCAGVAGLAALAHFKRPDVSLEGDIVKVRCYKCSNLFAAPSDTPAHNCFAL